MLTINGTLVAIVINFIILVYVLNYFLYKPVMQILEGRKKHVEETLAQADAKMSAAKAFMEEGRETIKAANLSAKEIIDQAAHVSSKVKKEMLDKARKDLEDLRARTKQEIKQYKNEARKELINEAGKLSVVIAEKVIMKKIDKKSSKRMVDNFIDSIVN